MTGEMRALTSGEFMVKKEKVGWGFGSNLPWD
jgi:hypothetical protein